MVKEKEKEKEKEEEEEEEEEEQEQKKMAMEKECSSQTGTRHTFKYYHHVIEKLRRLCFQRCDIPNSQGVPFSEATGQEEVTRPQVHSVVRCTTELQKILSIEELIGFQRASSGNLKASESSTIGSCRPHGFSQKSQSCEGSSSSQDTSFSHILQDVLLNAKLCKLVPFLLHKYQKKEQVTMKEMLHVLPHDYCKDFHLNLQELCESVHLGFGIDISEVDHSGNTYELVPILGLTYNGILDGDDERIILKIDIIIFILSLIFIEGNCIIEEDLTQKVERWDMLAQSEHIHFEETWKFISEDLVQEEYLMYQQIPNSDPAHYEFLWGSRAHAETSKMKLLGSYVPS
ncbi:Melanoma-associated antigen B10 [Heterocephalus glaber]|uniref:Melanoma-associated antigen B10 n=1 Tax=Heterocephalus glaber TaxID=10181 RepID=G5BX73_HETGA|nr:Melanoma-associated antigen B10 [Heterocephalus glaber]